jgi:hypothetical protein
MTDEELTTIRERVDAATPGPWGPGTQSRYTLRFPIHQAKSTGAIQPRSWQRACICREARLEDVTFIAHARTDIPALLAEVERLHAALRAVEWVQDARVAAVKSVCAWCGMTPLDGHAPDCQRQRALGVTP